MANRNYSMQDIQRIARMLMGQGSPNPYMGLDLRNRLGDWWNRTQAQYFPNQYNNMLYYIPDANDEYANKLADRVYNNY